MKDVLAARAAELQSVSHENRAGDQTIQATLSAYLLQMRECGDLLVRINRLGLGDHPREVTEAQAQRVIGALTRTLSFPEFGLTHEQQRAIAVRLTEEMQAE